MDFLGTTCGSVPGDAAGGHAGTPTRRGDACAFDESDDATAMAGERRQQLEHAFVVPARLTGERERHRVGQVVVADADRVGIAEGHEPHFG